MWPYLVPRVPRVRVRLSFIRAITGPSRGAIRGHHGAIMGPDLRSSNSETLMQPGSLDEATAKKLEGSLEAVGKLDEFDLRVGSTDAAGVYIT